MSVSAGAIVMGALLMNQMSFYVAALAKAGVPAWGVALLGWSPWAIARVAAFATLGVLLAEPLFARVFPAARSRLKASGPRRLRDGGAERDPGRLVPESAARPRSGAAGCARSCPDQPGPALASPGRDVRQIAPMHGRARQDTAKGDAHAEPQLVRAIGVRQLTASIVNVTVGAGIFVLPAAVAANLGAAAPAAYLVCAVAMALIVTSFALAGSRVSVTGGIYAYVEVAFGPFVGVLAGMVQWLVLWLTAAGLTSAFADQVGLLAAGGGGRGFRASPSSSPRSALLAFVNVRGVKPGARLVEGITVAKLLPLALLIGVGVFAIDPAHLAWPGWPGGEALGSTVLLLIFAFAGIEVALVPSGEVREPERTVPRAIGLALALTTLLYLAIQAVAQGVLGGELQQEASAPLAAAAGRLLGDWGRTAGAARRHASRCSAT